MKSNNSFRESGDVDSKLYWKKFPCEPVQNFLRKITFENFLAGPLPALPDIFQPCLQDLYPIRELKFPGYSLISG